MTTTQDTQEHLGRTQVESLKIGNSPTITGGAWTQTTATLTNATLGTGTTNIVRFLQLGKLCIASYVIGQTAAGVAAGTLRLSLPVRARTVITPATGHGHVIATSGIAILTPYLVASGTQVELFATTNAAGPVALSDAVFGIGANAVWSLTLNIMYETE
jgi:hypothetical protein